MVNDEEYSHINVCGRKYDLKAPVLFYNFVIIMLITRYLLIWKSVTKRVALLWYKENTCSSYNLFELVIRLWIKFCGFVKLISRKKCLSKNFLPYV